jgi:predicted metal-binding protein
MQRSDDPKFLEETALSLGAAGAKIIATSDVIVENRVALKCRVGCPSYGTKLNCPPNVPTPDEFRKILCEYSSAMVVKLAPPSVGELKASSLASHKEYYKRSLSVMLEIEKAAFNAGFAFSTAFFCGTCMLCDQCNIEKGVCLNPTMARISAEAVGINVIKTAEKAGMAVNFPVELIPGPMAILLID